LNYGADAAGDHGQSNHPTYLRERAADFGNEHYGQHKRAGHQQNVLHTE
jgi:hypothetical protein